MGGRARWTRAWSGAWGKQKHMRAHRVSKSMVRRRAQTERPGAPDEWPEPGTVGAHRTQARVCPTSNLPSMHPSRQSSINPSIQTYMELLIDWHA
eukprot:365535-Chlamydomonas_euryale.AAC.69